jgi:LmbE family N-acetylglucosaminyl deacetylase
MASALAIFAHPDDIEFVAAGTMLLLAKKGWDLHYMNLCDGNCGSLQMGADETAKTRLLEARASARLLGARFHAPICGDLELNYDIGTLRKIASVVRGTKPSILLTHSPVDYMEDHMFASRLAVSAAFARGIPNFETTPPREPFMGAVTIYHAMPHGLRDPLRKRVAAGLYVDTTSVHARKREALAAHASQRQWLDVTQGMDSYLGAMEEASRAVGRMSGKFEFSEGWRRHSHLGFSSKEVDPLLEVLGENCLLNPEYEESLG